MNQQLSESINTYFAASNEKDLSRIQHCFCEDATVIDEGSTRRGHAAIQSWMQEAQNKYEYSVEPISAAKEKERVIVTATVSGNFPGSPAQLHYAFLLNEHKIQSLEIY